MALTDKEKKAAIQAALQNIDKQFGKGTIRRLGDAPAEPIEVMSTGLIGLDLALGVGGLPRGRIVELYGPEQSGKTTLALHIIAEAQRLGGQAAFIDMEHALDTGYARAIGVDTDDLLFTQPGTGEEGLEIVEALVRTNAIDVIVIDSVAALVPKAEIEGEMGAAHVGLQARLMSQACRKLTGVISKSKAIVIFINQLREKVGVMFGSPEVTPGGRALKFYTSVRLDVRRKDVIKLGTETIGNQTTIKVVKNKVAPPFKVVEVELFYGKGISQAGMLINLGLDRGILAKAGSAILFGDRRLGAGREAARQTIDGDPELKSQLAHLVMAHGRSGPIHAEQDATALAAAV